MIQDIPLKIQLERTPNGTPDGYKYLLLNLPVVAIMAREGSELSLHCRAKRTTAS
jgi:hypothetical protein